ncbi:TPA: hypothetical protein ACL9MO_005306, partial [Klebsiella pneumoniae]
EKVKIFKSLNAIPSDILENLKQQVSENKILIESKDFLTSFNSMLIKFNIKKLVIGNSTRDIESDDIPF